MNYNNVKQNYLSDFVRFCLGQTGSTKGKCQEMSALRSIKVFTTSLYMGLPSTFL